MTRDDEKLVRDLKEMKADLMDAAVKMREKVPTFSYLLYRYAELSGKAAERLTPMEPEMEGGNESYFPVCADCHGVIKSRKEYCDKCGRAQKWSG